MKTFEEMEARAKQLSVMGCKLKLEPTAMEGWQWEWMVNGYVMGGNYTDATNKPVALWMALQSPNGV